MNTNTPFDPDFDDCTWNDEWLSAPFIPPVPGVYGDHRVTRWMMDTADICGQMLQLTPALAAHGLIDAEGILWMSDVPQERLMMHNNAMASSGRILVGGMGLGLYPQYVLSQADSITIIERESLVCKIVEPQVQLAAAAAGIKIKTEITSIEDFLDSEPEEQYDTIFLDTWHTLDAAILPAVNALRDQAVQHLAPGGHILLWGYHWMLNLFEDACRQILTVSPTDRLATLESLTNGRPDIYRLLLPIYQEFDGQSIEDWEVTLPWCKKYISKTTNV